MEESDRKLREPNAGRTRESFAKRLGEITGSAIHSTSWHINRDINSCPDNVVLTAGRAATPDEVLRAWQGSNEAEVPKRILDN